MVDSQMIKLNHSIQVKPGNGTSAPSFKEVPIQEVPDSVEEIRSLIRKQVQEGMRLFPRVLGETVAERAGSRLILVPINDPIRDHWFLMVRIFTYINSHSYICTQKWFV